MSENKKTIPVLPLRGITVFPNMIVHFDVGRDKSLKAIETAMMEDEKILLITQKDPSVNDPKQEDLYSVGTVVSIKQIVKLKPPLIKVLVEGDRRAKIIEINQKEFMEATIEYLEPEELENTQEVEALIRMVGDLFEKYAKLNENISMDMVYAILGGDDYSGIMDLIVANISLETQKKQDILECTNLLTRMYKVIEVLETEIELLQLQKKIQIKVKSNIDKTQKEYFLREQLKVIQEELGEKDGVKADIDIYRSKMKELGLQEEIASKLEKEINRLLKVSSSSPESGLIRTYIDTVLDLPWNIQTKEMLDLQKAQKILEKDHYGLAKIKERIIEYLAVRKFATDITPPILCLVGPPGVGKTSIAKSIATATGRNYVRISLGGLRDEAEIRGHRRTYVGAIPGRFVSALKQAKSSNPVMLLDEIDKMMGDFRGDPASALLEVLDHSQNGTFRDHYLEVPIDLSKVMFIATANSLATIPKPLLDRMEIIQVSSYTAEEKLEIAKKYLFPNQLQKHGLTKKQCKMADKVLGELIELYTKESGVRELNRQLGNICRKAARDLIEEEKESITLTKNQLLKYLGSPRYSYDLKNKEAQVGVVRGLAWTSVGGDTLSIEVNCMQGKGSLELTGNMGNVMKESAKAAISFIRSQAEKLQVEKDFHQKVDMHIHIPEGAVPKDGPSAGITMATAILSALTNQKVRNDLAMTGEVTIRGRVLPIGGLKEKLLAAKRAGIFEVIVPKANEKDIKELEQNILEGIHVIYAETMEDVLKHVFIPDPKVQSKDK
jgi:ATP-dependent Lon protease